MSAILTPTLISNNKSQQAAVDQQADCTTEGGSEEPEGVGIRWLLLSGGT